MKDIMVFHQVQTEVDNHVRKQIRNIKGWNYVSSPVWSQVYDQVGGQIWNVLNVLNSQRSTWR